MSSSSTSSDTADSESESSESENNALEANNQDKKEQPKFDEIHTQSASKSENKSDSSNNTSDKDDQTKSEDKTNSEDDSGESDDSDSESMDKSIPANDSSKVKTDNSATDTTDQKDKEPSNISAKSIEDPNISKDSPKSQNSKSQVEETKNDENNSNDTKDSKIENSSEQQAKDSNKSENASNSDSNSNEKMIPDEISDPGINEISNSQEAFPIQTKNGTKQQDKSEVKSQKNSNIENSQKNQEETSQKKSKTKSQDDSDSHSKKKQTKSSKPVRKGDTKSSPKNSSSKAKTKDDSEKSYSRSYKQIEQEIEREDAEIEAVYQFNTHKNVQKLCNYFNAEETPEGIAHVIRTTKGLNGSIIGDYLGKKENNKILIAYFMELDLKCDFIEAMRRSLSGPMFMPGEGQIIDRIIETFSDCYVAQNPQYKNSNELFVLSFALVMLNSDLHNRNNPRPMTEKQFIDNTKHSLSSNDFTDKQLADMYNEIKTREFQFTTHTNDFWWEVAPKIRGYLEKKSEHSFAKWTKEYFVLTNSCLYYFKDDSPENEGNPLGVIQLTEVEVDADSKNPRLIRINAVHDQIAYVKFRKIPKAVKGIKRITFKAPDRASASRWLHRLKKSAIMTNFLGDKMNDNNPPPNAKL